jgi:Domain of unknown function (DUF222)
VTAVLEALGKRAGPEDTRTAVQRRHDALEEACRRLIAAGIVPGRAGQPTQAQVHITLSQLRSLPGASEAEAAWRATAAATCEAPAREAKMIGSLAYLRVESPDAGAWREFGVRVLGMAERRGPNADAVYLRMDDFPARLVIVPGERHRLLASGWEVAGEDALAGVGRRWRTPGSRSRRAARGARRTPDGGPAALR